MGNSNQTLTTTAVTGPEETPHREKAGQTGRHPLPTHQQHHQTEHSQHRNHPKTHPRNHHRWIQAERALASLQDASAIEDHLGRLVGAADSDPARAIGSAKELIESTAKVVLRERGVVFNDKADVPELVKAAQESLGLHAGQHVAGPDGTPAVKRILGGLSSIALGVMELRNAGYGTGHGQVGRKVGLSSRHAHLAVNAATTWCRMMLDTLQDPKAPWTKQQVTPEP